MFDVTERETSLIIKQPHHRTVSILDNHNLICNDFIRKNGKCGNIAFLWANWNSANAKIIHENSNSICARKMHRQFSIDSFY